jgi:hypothetical protein
MDDEATTKPTIETVLERLNALCDSLGGRLGAIEAEISALRLDVQKLDRRLEVLGAT